MSHAISIKGKTPEERAATADTLLKNGLSHWRACGIALGGVLWAIHSENLWKYHDTPSFAAYLAQPDIDLRPSQGYLLLRVYSRFVIEDDTDPDDIKDVSPSKLDLCVPYLKNAEPKELVRLARELTRDDLKKYLAEKYDGEAADDTPRRHNKCPYWTLDVQTGKWGCAK